MYTYGVRRDTLGHWEFECSTRHCMEFKITKDKIARWNKMLLFWIKWRKYTHIAWFLLSIWHISSFGGGGFRCLSQLSIDKFKAGHCGFETPGTQGSFLAKSEFAARFFPLMKEAQFIGPIFRSAWKNLRTIPSNLNDFCFTTGAFNFPMHLVTILQTTAQLGINISDRSCMTNVTYQTGAQSKISVKNITLSL